MEQGRIIVISGAPGTGKTTAAALAARDTAAEKSVCMRTDDFYAHLCKGAVAPHLPQADTQNGVVIEAFLQAAMRYARGGYEVMVDGVVGPWFLSPFCAAAKVCEVHYIVLRADREETLRRAVGRDKLDRETNAALVEAMWPQFAQLGAYERHVIDTTRLTPQETAERILTGVERGTYRLKEI